MKSHKTSKHDRGKPVAWWEVAEQTHKITGEKVLRLSVTYENGLVRVLPPSFPSREELDKYVARFHPDYTGKERSG